MNLKEFKKKIDDLIDAGYGDALVVSASDDEGNSFSEVFYDPTKGTFFSLGNTYGDFFGEGELTEEDMQDFLNEGVKAVCIN